LYFSLVCDKISYVESFKHERFFLVLLKPKKNFILEGESHGEH